MGQAESERSLRIRVAMFAASSCLFLPSPIENVLSQGSQPAPSSTSLSAFQENRPRRVSSPPAYGKAGAEANSSADPPPVKPISAVRERAIPSTSSNSAARSFTVQLGAFLNRGNARQLARLLETQGYNPDVSAKKDAQKRLWHLVRVGSHPDRQSASAAAVEIEKKLKMKAIVRPANSL